MALVELDETLEHQKNTNTTRQPILESVENHVSTAHHYLTMAVQMSSAADLLGLMDCVKDASQDYLDVELPRIQNKEGPLAFSKEGLLELKEGVAKFGCVCTTLNDSALSLLSGEIGRHDTTLDQLKKEIKDVEAKSRHVEERQECLQHELSHFKKIMNEFGLTLHCLSESEGDMKWLCCVKLAYDKEAVNQRESHINEDGYLLNNVLLLMTGDCSKQFVNYMGTSSTVPLPLMSCLQYWETISQVQVTAPFTDYLVIVEIGVCQTDDRDKKFCMRNSPNSFAINVVHCLKHSGKCREVWQNGMWVKCLPFAFPNTTGSSGSLHIGEVYDATQARAAVMDLGQRLVMSTSDNLDTSKPLWPMFGVYNRAKANIAMKLLVGENITMTSAKKDLIRKSLKYT